MRKYSILILIAMVGLSAAITAQASLIQWLTVTNGSTLQTTAGTVTNWLDSSGSGNNTTNAGAIIGGPRYPSASLSASGIPGVDLGTNRNGFRLWTTNAQDSWLDFTQAGPTGAQGKSGFAVLVAFKIDANASSSSRNTVLASHGNPAANPSFVLKYETGYPACYIGSGTNNTQYINDSEGAELGVGDTVVFAFNYNAATGFWELWDSKSGERITNTAAVNGNFSSAQTMYLGTSENSGQWFSGDVFEVKIYDNLLTTPDLSNAFQSMIAQWVKPELIQHLDASVPASVTTNASGRVVTWLDQTTRGNDGTPLTGADVGLPKFPSTSLSGSGKAGVDLGTNSWPGTGATNRSGIDLLSVTKQTNWLDFNPVTGAARNNSGFSALVAFKADSVLADSGDNTVLVNHGNSTFTDTFGLRFDASGTMETFIGGTIHKKTSGLKISAGDTIVYAFSYDAATGEFQFWDSKNNNSLTAMSTPAGDFVRDQPMRLGVSGNNQQQFNGLIGEVKIFAGKLDSSTLVSEGQALAAKWGATQPPNPTLDSDGDGLSDADEAIYGTDRLKPDTDEDGAGDWYEIFASFTNPTNAASKPNVPYPLPKPDNSTGVTNKPVKVFILSGQSNMVGPGDVNPLGTKGTLSTIVKQQGKFPNLLNASSNWSVRKDVKYRGVVSSTTNADLTVGQGENVNSIGPELGFGHVMGYHLNEPVLIIKASQGNRSLGWDYLPPGSPRFTVGSTTYAGYGDSQASWTGTPPGPPGVNQWYGGWQYDRSFLNETNWAPLGTLDPITNVTDVLDNWATQYPQWAAQGFEIAGFAWFQGWNDGLSYTTAYADRYETNLVQLIKQLRTHYEGRYPGKIRTNAPFVVATCGFNGWSASGNRLKVVNAQLAVSNTNKYPGFAGNVKTMESRGYWRDVSLSPNTRQDYHYYRNAETFLLVGDALGRGMIDLLGAGTVSDYSRWATNFPGANLSDPNADFDGDKLSNDYERIWGLNPTNAASKNPFASIANLQSGSFTYTRRTQSLTLLNYTVWTSTNLLTWAPDPGALQTPSTPANQIETVTVNLSPALFANPSLFVRLRANSPVP